MARKQARFKFRSPWSLKSRLGLYGVTVFHAVSQVTPTHTRLEAAIHGDNFHGSKDRVKSEVNTESNTNPPSLS